jgi:hypothetical protein
MFKFIHPLVLAIYSLLLYFFVCVFYLRIVGILQPLHDAVYFIRAVFYSFVYISHSTYVTKSVFCDLYNTSE